jgi:hypothetical protein
MAKNTNLREASLNKNDEYYTRYDDIKNELIHYTRHFKDKTIYCNCDDHNGIGLGTPKSNFIKYLADNFQAFGIKKVIATHYEKDKKSTKYILDKDNTGKNIICMEDVMEFRLNSDGDFRLEECIELLKQSDIVITNPPFSLFREYVAQLFEYKKKFIIIGNKNAITYKEIFPLIKNNKLWTGNTPFGKDLLFDLPDWFAQELIKNKREGSGYKIINGVPKGRSQSVWFTNLDHKKRHEILDTGKKYRGYENMYPKYDNYNAINVDKVSDIPMDYNKMMGVPITFLDKFNPAQFEIIGIAKRGAGDPSLRSKIYTKDQYDNYSDLNAGPVLADKRGYLYNTYPRILIKKKRNK